MRRACTIAALVASAGLLTGCPGPSVSECAQSQDGTRYCDAERVVVCGCFDNYPNGGYGCSISVEAQCALDEVCVVVDPDDESYDLDPDDFIEGRGDARCVPVDSCLADPDGQACRDSECDMPTSVQCAASDNGGTTWRTCADADATAAARAAAVNARQSGDPPALGDDPEVADTWVWSDTACTLCTDDCECEVGQVCFGGACVSGVLDVTLSCDANQVVETDVCGRVVDMRECGDGRHCEAGSCVVTPPPDIEVSPTLLSFPDTAVGNSATLQLSIGNLGEWPLMVDAIEPGPTLVDQIALSQTQLEVAVDAIVTVDVVWTPSDSGTTTGRIEIVSDDPDEPSIEVLINGNAL